MSGAVDLILRLVALFIGRTLLALLDHDALEFLFFIEEVGYVKKRIALESDVDECGLHSRQNPLNFSFVYVAYDSGILFTTFDVKLGDFPVVYNCDLLFASIDADDHLFCHRSSLF